MGRPKRIEDPRSTPGAKARRLRRLRKFTTLDRPDLCKKYGINQSTFKGWENARANGLSDKGAKQLIELAQAEGVICTFDWLMYGVGTSPRIVERFDEEKSPAAALHTDEEEQIIHELQFFRKAYPDSLDYIVIDNGMEPHFQKDDYIAGVKFSGKSLEKVLDKNCIIQTEDKRLLFRKVTKGKVKDMYILTCINPKTTVAEPVIYNIKLLSAAPVLWHRRKNYNN